MRRTTNGRTIATSAPERVLDILLSFTHDGPELSVRAIGEAFGTSRSSTYRYLQMLRERELVEETAVAGHYRLGPRVLELARCLPGALDFTAIAEPVMRDLAQETRETVLLTLRAGERVVCISCVESPEPIRISFEPARDTPLHAGSAAKIHFAHLDAHKIEGLLSRPLERLTPNTLTDPSRLRTELEWIRRHGYATSEGEVDLGVRSVSVPLFGPGGHMTAGLTLAGPKFRFTKQALRRLLPRVRSAADTIVAHVGAASLGGWSAARTAPVRTK